MTFCLLCGLENPRQALCSQKNTSFRCRLLGLTGRLFFGCVCHEKGLGEDSYSLQELGLYCMYVHI